MMMAKTFTILNPSGFHVRPTKTFVQTASTFPCKVNVISKGKKANGKSLLIMLTLGIAANEEVTLETDGEREEQAMEALGQILTQVHE